MRKKILWRTLILTMFLIGINVTFSKAATISATSKTVNSGENFSVSISSNVPVGSYKVTMTNKPENVKFVTSSGGTGEGTTSITNANSTSGMTSLATYTFKAPEVYNDTTYKIEFLATAMEDMNLNSIANESATATITVKAKSGNNSETSTSGENTSNTASSNAKLSNLGIRPNNFDFDNFDANILEYNATVPNNVTSVSVYANVQQPGAKYSVSGPYNNLQVGTNVMKVVVTAPDGTTTKTYKINVTRQAQENEPVTPNVIENNNENETDYIEENTEVPLGLLTIGIGEEYEIYLEPEFKPEIYEYTINLKEDLKKIPLNAVANREGAKVEITGNEDLQEGENIIKITVAYDEIGESVEYKIIVNKVLEKQAEIENEDSKKEEGPKTEEIKWLIMGIATAALVVIIIITFIIGRKGKKFEQEFDVEYDENNYDDNYFGRNIENNEEYDKQPEENPFELKTEPGLKLEQESGSKLEPEPQSEKLDYSYKVEKPKKRRRGKGKHF